MSDEVSDEIFSAKDLHKPEPKREAFVVILTTPQLATAIHTADRQRFHRRVDPFFTDQLDRDGTHVVGFHVVAEIDRPGFSQVARCQILCKTRFGPRHLWLDIDLDVFNRYERITESELKEGRSLGRF